MWFVKARRAQNQDDDETWKQGGVTTTLNAFDNGGESRATVLIIDGTRVGDVRVTDEETMQTVIQRWGTGGGNVPAIAYALDSLSSNSMKSSNPKSGSREITLSKTVDTNALNPAANQGGVAIVAYSIREDATANNFSATEIEQARALQALQPSVQSHHAQTFIAEPLQVRRLTPMECERLQGFPDGWTATQSDSQRYRQMGNAVTVNVIESIGQQLGRVSNG
jgi:site-specific DNA-cytosine methylase